MPRSQVFGKRQQQHTVIIATGETVRSFTVRPAVIFGSAGVIALFFIGYISATAYLMMRDDLIGAGRTHQAEVVRQYEDRIAALRAQVDRAKSQQLVDQRNIEDNMRRLLARQEKLSLRHGQLAPLIERAQLSGLLKNENPVPVPMPRPDQLEANAAAGIAAIEAATGTKASDAEPSRLAHAFLSTGSIGLRNASAKKSAAPPGNSNPQQAVESVATSLRKMETEQVRKVDVLTKRAIQVAGAIQTVLKRSGLPSKIEEIASRAGKATVANSGIGGPYIRLADPAGFDMSLHKLDAALDRLESVRGEARKLPFGEPLANEVVTSPFGARPDPFLDRAAFHPGVDLRAARGTDVHATGNGTVTFAGRDAGYGNMVQIDHGDGVSTRYGHLSDVLVHDGEHVSLGEVVGKSGSTGRSTGPHLHYEVRLNDQPVNPIRFLDSGRSLQAYLHN